VRVHEVAEINTILIIFLMWFFFGSIWLRVLSWLRICNVLHYDVCMHALQFGGSHLF